MRSIADACSRELGEALGSLIEEEGPVVLYELTLLESNEYGCVARGMESGRLLPAELASKEAAPDKPERLETPERPEKPEKPERPDCCCSCWTLRLRRLLWSCDGVGTMVDGTDAVGVAGTSGKPPRTPKPTCGRAPGPVSELLLLLLLPQLILMALLPRTLPFIATMARSAAVLNTN